jgi:hypothetical protein
MVLVLLESPRELCEGASKRERPNEIFKVGIEYEEMGLKIV